MAALYKEVKKTGRKKILIVLICVAAAVLLALMVIGIIAGNMSDEKTTISDAVSENVQLKQQIDDLNAQLDEKQAMIDELQAELDARPTQAPEPTAAAEDESAQRQTSPRANRE